MIIYGHRLYGKVDAVPGVGHVATKFIHIDYVPLVPTESWLVTAQSGKTWRGVKVPLSAKSVFVAWARAISLVVGVATAVLAVVQATGRRADAGEVAVMAVVAAATLGFFAFTKTHRLFKRASYARACQLAKLLRMNDQGLAALAEAYGQPIPTFGFQPVMAPPTPVVPEEPLEVERVEDDNAPPEPPKAAAPLRGY